MDLKNCNPNTESKNNMDLHCISEKRFYLIYKKKDSYIFCSS